MYLGDGATERCPAALIESQGHGLLSIQDKMGPEYRLHTGVGTRMLKLDRTIDAVGIRASQRLIAPLRRGLGECLGTGRADTEGKMGVDVEVGEHLFFKA
jgi:hypothetical protein